MEHVFQTGDVIISCTTQLSDLLGDFTIGLKGMHCSVIMCGKEFEKYSVCGKSTSDTYCTFLVDKIFPLEEICGAIWTKPNGSKFIHIKRLTGPEISVHTLIESLEDFKTYEKVDSLRSTRMAIFAYLKLGSLDQDLIESRLDYGLCSQFVGKVLYDCGLLQPDAVVNGLLPYDFDYLKFYQKYKYRRIVIFNKRMLNFQALTRNSLIHLGFIEPESFTHPAVEAILGEYDFPRVKSFDPLKLIGASSTNSSINSASNKSTSEL